MLAALDPDGSIVRKMRAGKAPARDSQGSAPLPGDFVLPPLSKRIQRAVKYLRRIPGGVDKSNGSSPTFYAARVLIHGYCLDPHTAMALMLDEYNPKCVPPWSEADLRHKLDDAATKPFKHERGWVFRPKTPPPAPAAAPPPPPPPRGDQSATPPRGADAESSASASPGASFGVGDALEARHLAETFLADRHRVTGDSVPYRLVNHDSRFVVWSAGAYRVLAEQQATNGMLRHAEGEAHVEYRAKLADFKGEGRPPVRQRVTRNTVLDALAAVVARVTLPESVSPPCWLTPGDGRPDPKKLIPTEQGIINPFTGEVLPLTPELFTLAASPHFLPSAKQPALWLRFLQQSLGGEASIETLQEFAGLLLTPDTSYQKFLLLVGKVRGGKGTIMKVLTELVGKQFATATSFSRLCGEYGTAPLVGKQLVTMGDVRIGTRTDVSEGLRTMLEIIGEDEVSVNEKNKKIISCKIGARFVVAANEMPNIQDSAMALASRAVVLRFTRSFLGKEDKELFTKLKGEMAGIFAWALVGLRRLNERGHFVQPAAGGKSLDEFRDVLSPITRFLREKCVIDPDATVIKRVLFLAWETWMRDERLGTAGTPSGFGSKLRDANETIDQSRPTDSNGKRVELYTGVRLRNDSDDDADDS